jgi:hypothetical protein
LELATGERVPARCKASNRCGYCGQVSAIENAAVLRLDAESDTGRRPTVGITLTTKDPLTDGQLRIYTASFWRAFRQRWGRVEYCGFVEWTTGKARRAGGVRRTHVHYLVKDLRPDVELADVEAWVRVEWKKLAGAWVVEARELRTPAGAIAYLALHHQKREQAPPRGWSGKRLRPSKGYFNRPVRELRSEARLRLAEARALRDGRDPSLVRLLKVFDALSPRFVPHVEEDGRAHEGEPGNGLSDDEFAELAGIAARANYERDELDRLADVYRDTIRSEAAKRLRERRKLRAEHAQEDGREQRNEDGERYAPGSHPTTDRPARAGP